MARTGFATTLRLRAYRSKRWTPSDAVPRSSGTWLLETRCVVVWFCDVFEDPQSIQGIPKRPRHQRSHRPGALLIRLCPREPESQLEALPGEMPLLSKIVQVSYLHLPIAKSIAATRLAEIIAGCGYPDSEPIQAWAVYLSLRTATVKTASKKRAGASRDSRAATHWTASVGFAGGSSGDTGASSVACHG